MIATADYPLFDLRVLVGPSRLSLRVSRRRRSLWFSASNHQVKIEGGGLSWSQRAQNRLHCGYPLSTNYKYGMRTVRRETWGRARASGVVVAGHNLFHAGMEAGVVRPQMRILNAAGVL